MKTAVVLHTTHVHRGPSIQAGMVRHFSPRQFDSAVDRASAFSMIIIPDVLVAWLLHFASSISGHKNHEFFSRNFYTAPPCARIPNPRSCNFQSRCKRGPHRSWIQCLPSSCVTGHHIIGAYLSRLSSTSSLTRLCF